MKVLVCDDREDGCRATVDAIIRGGIPADEISSLHAVNLTKELENFFEGIMGNGGKAPVDSTFDDCDIIILDNNLSALGIRGARLTAEAIAGYIRAYSKATYIVSLNKNPDVDFDLRYLVGDYSTVADLALNTDHLENKALWTGDPNDAEEGFKPWYWPTLLDEPRRRREQIAFVRRYLDTPVFKALGIPAEVASYVSRHATGTLSPNARYEITSDESIPGVPVPDITFRDFFLSRYRSLPARSEREGLSANARSDSAESQMSYEIISRVVAADIDLWIRRDLIAPQDAFVDLPHLLARMPFLLGAPSSDPASWNSAIQTTEPPYGLDKTLFDEHLDLVRFRQEMWAPSVTFFWPLLKANEDLNELFFGSADHWADVAFCEDRSIFVARDKENQGSLSEFEAEFEGAWIRRYVMRIEGRKYAPLSRLAI